MRNQNNQPFPLRRIISKTSNSAASDDLMPKVPLVMRSSLKQHKEKQKKTLNFTDFFQQFKKVITLEQDCAICMSKITNPCSLAECQHNFCSECLLNYLTFKINSMQEIICPAEGCNKKLDIKSRAYKSLPQNYKQKYKKQQLWHQTIKNPDLKLCPIQTCKQGTINMRKIPPKCEKCQTIFCQQCMMKQHPGNKCDENFKMNFKEWKRCPKCSMFIQKTEGCNHMVCRCKNQFCFVCLQPWTNQHYSCVQNPELIFQRTFCCCEDVRFPKLLGLGLILLMPFMLVFAIGFLVLGSVLFTGIGLFTALFFSYQSLGDCCIAVIILLPFLVLGGIVVGFIWGTFFYLLPIVIQYARGYLKSIKNLCCGYQQ